MEETAFWALASVDRSAEPTSARLTATASFSATAPVSRTAAAPDFVASSVHSFRQKKVFRGRCTFHRTTTETWTSFIMTGMTFGSSSTSF